MFGKSMMLWRENTRNGMLLNSDTFPTYFSAPGNGFALAGLNPEMGRLG